MSGIAVVVAPGCAPTVAPNDEPFHYYTLLRPGPPLGLAQQVGDGHAQVVAEYIDRGAKEALALFC